MSRILGLLILLAPGARGDAAITGDEDVEVHDLPAQGQFRLTLDERGYDGGPAVWHGNEGHRTITLTLVHTSHGCEFELRSEGISEEISISGAGKREVTATPIQLLDTGPCQREGALLWLTTQEPGRRWCQIGRVSRSDVPGCAVDALVCFFRRVDEFSSLPLHGDREDMMTVPFGRVTRRHDGWWAVSDEGWTPGHPILPPRAMRVAPARRGQ